VTITWPEGVVDTAGSGDGDRAAEVVGASAVTLLGLSAAYQTAQYRISTAAEQASLRLWRQQRPLTDGDMTSWMLSWNALLAGYAAQQAGLTRAYANASLSRFGTSLPGVGAVEPFPTSVDEWLSSPQGRVAPVSLRDAAQRARDAIGSGSGTVQDAALVNRLAYLHSPVVKQRWNVSEGVDFDAALEDVGSFVSGQAYNAGRDVESLLMDAANWPSFKNGTAMLYKRVPQAGACGWCLLVATRLWSLEAKNNAEKKPFHVACRCAWTLVTYGEARAYSDELGKTGDYYSAAARIGNWTGPLPKSYAPTLAQRFDPKAAAKDGYVSREATDAERQRLADERERAGRRSRGTSGRTPAAPTVSPEREARAAALVAQAAPILARAQAAGAAGDYAAAKRLYEQAGRLTSQAYDLRMNR
jgi:hypothetical protein